MCVPFREFIALDRVLEPIKHGGNLCASSLQSLHEPMDVVREVPSTSHHAGQTLTRKKAATCNRCKRRKARFHPGWKEHHFYFHPAPEPAAYRYWPPCSQSTLRPNGGASHSMNKMPSPSRISHVSRRSSVWSNETAHTGLSVYVVCGEVHTTSHDAQPWRDLTKVRKPFTPMMEVLQARELNYAMNQAKK